MFMYLALTFTSVFAHIRVNPMHVFVAPGIFFCDHIIYSFDLDVPKPPEIDQQERTNKNSSTINFMPQKLHITDIFYYK